MQMILYNIRVSQCSTLSPVVQWVRLYESSVWNWIFRGAPKGPLSNRGPLSNNYYLIVKYLTLNFVSRSAQYIHGLHRLCNFSSFVVSVYMQETLNENIPTLRYTLYTLRQNASITLVPGVLFLLWLSSSWRDIVKPSETANSNSLWWTQTYTPEVSPLEFEMVVCKLYIIFSSFWRKSKSFTLLIRKGQVFMDRVGWMTMLFAIWSSSSCLWQGFLFQMAT